MGSKSQKSLSATGSGSSAKHKKLVQDILLSLNKFGRFWKTDNGVATLPKGQVIAFGLPGQGDIIGIKMGGRFVSIEVKTGGAVRSPKQILFHEMVLAMGGISILARSVEDAVEGLRTPS